MQLCKFYPPVVGGIESVVRELAEGLTQHDIDVTVLCANVAAHTTRQSLPGGCEITRASSWGRVLSTSVAPALLLQYARLQADCDIVHVHMPDPLTALAMRSTNTSAKVVVHWHSDVVRQRRSFRLYQPLQQWLLRRADAVVATSEAYASSSPCLRGVEDKTTVIPIGVRDEASASEDAARIRSEFGGRPIVFALGRMSAYKGFDVLIDAAARLPEDCIVVVGGAGELLARHRESVARLGLDRKIVFVGRISEASRLAFFDAATLFCLPSTLRSEAYGVVLAEAMRAGLPVVATTIPGSGVGWVNQSGISGLNVPVGDGEALASAIRQILQNPGLAKRFGRAARRRYEEVLTAERMVDATIRLYDEVLRRTSKASAHP